MTDKCKAKKAVDAYKNSGKRTDPNGSYTGNCRGCKKEKPVQDADDL